MFFDEGVLKPSSAIVPTQLSAAMACGYVLWQMQRSKALPWITQHTAGINTAVRAILSALATAGITFTWHSDGVIVIKGLTLAALPPLLYHWFVQYAAAQGFEKVLNVAPADSAQKQETAVVAPRPAAVPAQP